jgi:4-diphosphocytidyl-2-C-methyl-D-erythritol kinase
MKLKSYSKINLSLRVLNKLKNGMHNIETNSTLVELSDEIDIKKDKKDKIYFTGKFKDQIDLKKNTVKDTLRLLKKNKVIKGFYKITVKKNIPVYAGLGGGTSNSYSIAEYFLNNRFNEKMIKIFEEKIGSDFRLFLNKNSFQKKFKKVYKTKNSINSYILIIFPYVNCETKKIYKMVDNFSLSSGNFYSKKINRKKFIEMIKKDHNDLQELVEKRYPIITQLILSIFDQVGCIFSRMTGSGSACYGVFKSKKTAQFAITKLKRKYPKYWCVVTKTI